MTVDIPSLERINESFFKAKEEIEMEIENANKWLLDIMKNENT